jgi:hypothetical protein
MTEMRPEMPETTDIITTVAELEALRDGDRVVDRYGDVGHVYQGNVEFFETAPLSFDYVIRKFAPLRLAPISEQNIDLVGALRTAGDTLSGDAAREIERLRLLVAHEWVANSRRLCSCGASPENYGLPTDGPQWLTWEQWHREHRAATSQEHGDHRAV